MPSKGSRDGKIFFSRFRDRTIVPLPWSSLLARLPGKKIYDIRLLAPTLLVNVPKLEIILQRVPALGILLLYMMKIYRNILIVESDFAFLCPWNMITDYAR